MDGLRRLCLQSRRAFDSGLRPRCGLGFREPLRDRSRSRDPAFFFFGIVVGVGDLAIVLGRSRSSDFDFDFDLAFAPGLADCARRIAGFFFLSDLDPPSFVPWVA